MFKIILLNGPKLSGKDTLADLIVERQDYTKMQFKGRLYEIGAMVAGMELDHYITLCTDRVTKDSPCEGFNYLTPREHLIHVSENVIKPLLGDDYFGLYLAGKIRFCRNTTTSHGVVISDSGFEEELIPILKLTNYVGGAEVHVVRLYKNGCTFEGDSRDYLPNNVHCDITYHDITVVEGDIKGTYESIQASVGGF